MNRAAYIIGWIVGRVVAVGRVAGDWFADGFERGREWLPLKPDPAESEPVEPSAAAKLSEIFGRAVTREGLGRILRKLEDPNDRYVSAGYDRPDPPLPAPQIDGDDRSVSSGDDVPIR